jgi:hypothetical protein
MLQNDFFLSPDALAPDGEETIAIRRPVPFSDDTRSAELATTRLWKLAFTPSGPLVYGFDRWSMVEKAHAHPVGDFWLSALEGFFPGLRNDLIQRGAVPCNLSSQFFAVSERRLPLSVS